jgi:Domain of unknown function (DUF4175)
MIQKSFTHAYFVLLIERLWGFAFWALLAVISALGLSLLGFKIAALIVFFFGLCFSLYQLKGFKKPSQDAILARLNQETGQAHRPVTSSFDTNIASSPLAKELWARHLASLHVKLSFFFPRLNTPRLDPYALRVIPYFLLALGLYMSPSLKDAFDFSSPPSKGWRTDIWVTPPNYTGLSPVLLFTAKDESGVQRATQQEFPKGSKLSFRASGFKPKFETSLKALENNDFILESDANFTLQNIPRLGKTEFALKALSDKPPQVRFTSPLFANEKNHLSLQYEARDDYGVVSGEVIMQLHTPSTFIKIPVIELNIPPQGKGLASLLQDFTSHPFVGLEMSVQLKVKDEQGQEGVSAKHIFVFPGRSFTKPLAQALIELRQRLALARENKLDVLEGLDLLMLTPEIFNEKPLHYLAFRTLSTRLKRARGDAGLQSVLDYFYEVALNIEDGNLSDAERELKAAQEALENALKNNADDNTLQQLTQNLKDAIQKMLQELAKDLENTPFEEGETADLNDQLKDLENLTQEGAQDQAQRLLDSLKQQLQDLMQAKREGRLRRAQPNQQQQDKNALSNMIRRQQQLRDQTFQDKADPQAQEQLRQDLENLKNDKLGEAGEAMREAEKQMRQGNKQGAMEAQRRALQGLQQEAQAQAEREREQQQGEGEGRGEGQRQGRNDNDPKLTDPLGRRQQGKEDATTTKSPDLLSRPEAAQKILEELRKRSGETLRPQEERDYIDRLLKGLK